MSLDIVCRTPSLSVQSKACAKRQFFVLLFGRAVPNHKSFERTTTTPRSLSTHFSNVCFHCLFPLIPRSNALSVTIEWLDNLHRDISMVILVYWIYHNECSWGCATALASQARHYFRLMMPHTSLSWARHLTWLPIFRP